MLQIRSQFAAFDQALDSTGPRPAYGHAVLEHRSAAPLPDCPGSCITCAHQYLLELWKEEVWKRAQCWDDDETAKATVLAFVEDANVDLTFIREQIQQHGDTTMKRWRRRDSDKRAKLLLTANPDIHREKWLLANYMYDTRRKVIKRGPQLLHTLLLPYIDLPSLSQNPMHLLALIHYRTQYEPSDWVLLDSAQLNMPFRLGCTRNDPHCVVMYGRYYGRLIPWNADSAHRYDIMGYPRAKLEYESQRLLFRFLRRMVELVIGHDTPQAAKRRDGWDALTSHGFRSPSLLASTTTYFPKAMSPAPMFNAEELLQIIHIRRNAAHDKLWLLQTDAVYFRGVFQQFKTSYMDSLPNEKRKFLVQETIRNVMRF